MYLFRKCGYEQQQQQQQQSISAQIRMCKDMRCDAARCIHARSRVLLTDYTNIIIYTKFSTFIIALTSTKVSMPLHLNDICSCCCRCCWRWRWNTALLQCWNKNEKWSAKKLPKLKHNDEFLSCLQRGIVTNREKSGIYFFNSLGIDSSDDEVGVCARVCVRLVLVELCLLTVYLY